MKSIVTGWRSFVSYSEQAIAKREKKMERILLIIICSIFMSNTARAQGAWLLWEKEMRSGQLSEWKILEAYPNYDECKAAQRDWLEQMKRGFDLIKQRRDPLNRIKTISAIPFTIVLDYEEGSQRVFETQCLPDTIDPRK